MQLDPEHHAAVFARRHASISSGRWRDVGARVGFVYKSEDDLIFVPTRAAGLRLHVAVPFVDLGPDGLTGTADEQTFTLLRRAVARCGDALPGQQPDDEHAATSSRYKTVEASMNKRMSNRWSMQAGGSHTWAQDFLERPNNPNATVEADTTRWDFKVSGNYDGPRASASRRWCVTRPAPTSRADHGRRGRATAAGAHLQRHHRRGTVERAPARQHHRVDVRVERGFTLGAACACAVLRSVQHHEQQRGRNAHGLDRHDVPAADRGSRAADGAARRAVQLVENGCAKC